MNLIAIVTHAKDTLSANPLKQRGAPISSYEKRERGVERERGLYPVVGCYRLIRES